ncbi:MAG TPA: Fur family transcriptional regulator [Candidatus Dormibacteraeota bacterium]
MTAELHDAVAARIKTGEGRYTRSRRQLVEVLVGARQPLTVEEILGHDRELTLSSVYRNLAVFEETGLVRRLAGHGDFARFELAEELTGHHHHLACGRCGAMTDVELPARLENELESALAKLAGQQGFELESHRVDAVGRCSSCARQED